MRFYALPAALLGGTACLVAPLHAQAFTFHADNVLGTSLDVTVLAVSEKMASLALNAIHAEIARLDAILSGWRADSELAVMNAASSHTASADLFAVITAGEAWRERTGSAFNMRRAGGSALRLNPQSLEIGKPAGDRLAVDAIAKGYIIDKALEAARATPGVQGLLLDIGGDLRCSGQAPDGKGWKIGVLNDGFQADNAAPSQILNLVQGAVATSGQGARAQTIWEGVTGEARTGVRLATAIAPTAADADALATALYVMPAQQGLALVNSMRGAAARLVADDGMVHVSERWNGMLVAQNAAPRPAAPAALSWPAGFQVRIDYEIPFITNGRRVRPPYVAIWISDSSGAPVRSLAFYANKAKYMPENYVFWERVIGSKRALLNGVTRPTRPAGAYSLEWDGRDDAGRALPQGQYTVSVETAREHGDHNIQRIPISLGTAPASASAAPQTEMGVVKVTYGKDNGGH